MVSTIQTSTRGVTYCCCLIDFLSGIFGSLEEDYYITYTHMAFRSVQRYLILNAAATTGVGQTIDVRDFRNCVVKIGTATSANLTVKAQGAVASFTTDTTPPTFSAAQTVANNWDFIQMIDLQDGSPINGDVGFVVT